MPWLTGDAVDITALAHARGEPPAARAMIRASPDDFFVDEDMSIRPAGEGEHLWCRIEKRGLTTAQAVESLSRAFGVHPRHIGYAGLKDRVAVTRQWLSIAWPIARPTPEYPDTPGLRVLESVRHTRKLKRGAHRGNRFVLALTDVVGDREAIEADLARVAARGVPNYFGAQRFGRAGRNIALSRALFAGRRLSRNRRGFALSAARSLLFNAVLDRRVRENSWDRLLDGEAVMLDGTQSVFARNETAEPLDRLAERLAAFDIHPSGPLPGREAERLTAGEALALEGVVIDEYAEFESGLVACGVDAGRRALRLAVPDLSWRFDEPTRLVVSFGLPPGAFATVVLREFVRAEEPSSSESD